jgi:hypothetical protein
MISAVRTVAACAAAVATAGSLGVAVSVAGMSDLRTFVSETGVAGAPGAALYRSSMVAVAVAAGLLAFALRPVAGLAAAALGSAAPFGVVGGAVPCTPGCPLPPLARSTPTDLVHAGASILALGLSLVAMVVLAWSGEPSGLRRASRFALVLTMPLAAVSGAAIFLLGHGLVAGVTERAALVGALAWLVAVAGVRALTCA